MALEVDAELADVPRGLGHGDFWSGNLLVEEERLTGVVDWGAAGAGRLPLLDLFHLQVSARRGARGASLGHGVIAYATERNAVETDALRAYCHAIGFTPTEPQYQALLRAYWIQAVAREVVDPDRPGDPASEPRWQRENVEDALTCFIRPETGLDYHLGVMARTPTRRGTSTSTPANETQGG